MKLTKAMTGRRVTKVGWPVGVAERLLYVGSEWIITQGHDGKENVTTFDPKNNDWSLVPLDDSDTEFMDLSE